MRDVGEFAKLYKLKIPVEDHFSYYLDLLARSAEFSALPRQFAAFEALEARLSEKDKTFKSFYHDTLKMLAEHIKKSTAYSQVEQQDLLKLRKLKSHTFQPVPEKRYVSIDIRTANWTVLKCYESGPEFPILWEDYCTDPALGLSKSFRQIVFGNTNPKRFTHIQEHISATLYAIICNEFELAGASADEIIVAASGANAVQRYMDENIYREAFGFKYPIPFKLTEFTQEKIGKDQYVRNVCANGALLYKTLLGVPGNMFYMFFKKFILDMPIEERDLLFTQDGLIAKWVSLPSAITNV